MNLILMTTTMEQVHLRVNNTIISHISLSKAKESLSQS